MATVVLTLVFIPFGKFFHVIQRPASVGVEIYKRSALERDGSPPALRRAPGGQGVRDRPQADHGRAGAWLPEWAETCPRCKRVQRGQAPGHGRGVPGRARSATRWWPRGHLPAQAGPSRPPTGWRRTAAAGPHPTAASAASRHVSQSGRGPVIGVEPATTTSTSCPGPKGWSPPAGPPPGPAARPADARHQDGALHPVSWEGLDRIVSEIRRIQSTYGRDAFGVLGGASMTTEKTYLMGKFARVALRTRHIDYNGRLCTPAAPTRRPSASTGPATPGRPARDQDRSPAPAPSACVARGTSSRTGALVVDDPRDGHGPHRRRARGPAARHRRRLLQRHAARDRPRRPHRRALHRRAHRRLGGGPRHRGRLHPRAGGRDLRARPAPDRAGRPPVGRARRCWAAHGRGPEQHLQGVENVLVHQRVPRPPASSAAPGPATGPSPARATARAAASTPEVGHAAGRARPPTPSTAPMWPASGGRRGRPAPGGHVDARDGPADGRRRDPRPARHVQQPVRVPAQPGGGPGAATTPWSSTSSRTSSCRRRRPGPTWSCPRPSGPRTRAW